MLKIDIQQKRLTPLDSTTLTKQGLKERQDLEAFILNSFPQFASEIGLKAKLLGKQIYVSDEVLDHLDILAIDSTGKPLVIELKRSYDDNQLYQALGYAAMLSEWDLDDFADVLSRQNNVPKEESSIEILDFLDGKSPSVNGSQIICIIAEEFDFKTLITSKWLSEKFGIEIFCIRCDFAISGPELLLSLQILLPTAGLSELARDTRGRTSAVSPILWEQKIAETENREVADFFESELHSGQEHNSQWFHYRVQEKRRISMSPRKKHAYIWQTGRFAGDEEFWRSTLRPELAIETTSGGQSLSFTIKTQAELVKIKATVSGDLQVKTFIEELDW